MNAVEKPGYSTTRVTLYTCLFGAWAAIFALIAAAFIGSPMAVPMAQILVPSMVIMIGSILSIHRGFGSMDMRTIATQVTGEEPPK